MVVVTRADLEHDNTATTVTAPGRPPLPVASMAHAPGLTPRPRLLRAGPRELRCALLLPSDNGAEADGPLPVLLDPYGGPHAQRVLAARDRLPDLPVVRRPGLRRRRRRRPRHPRPGPGLGAGRLRATSPARSSTTRSRRCRRGRRAHPELDLHRVAIRGWCFGGYLAALAVLRRPDVFHAAVAGAPVTDWRLYDTHYTERYLGHPADRPRRPTGAARCWPTRPSWNARCCCVHGLADDNVVAAHTLRLSGLLLAAGRPHEVLPLSGVTHMTPQEVVAENLLLLQLDFLRDALGLT